MEPAPKSRSFFSLPQQPSKDDDQNHPSQFKFKRQLLRADAGTVSPRPILQSAQFNTTGKPFAGEALRVTQPAPYGLSLPLPADSRSRARQAEPQHNRLIINTRLPSPSDENNSDASVASTLSDNRFAQPLSMSENVQRVSLGRHPSPSPVQGKAVKNLSQRFDTDFHHSVHDNSYISDQAANTLPCAVPSDAPKSRQGSVHNNFLPPPHSRSVSVVSSAFGRQDDDISSIMMRGATDLRNTKFEVQEQRREIVFLKDQLEAAKGEKEEALKRLKAVKDAAKRSLESSSKSLSDLQSTLSDLKVKSDESFAVVSDAQRSMPDVRELRETVTEAMKSIEPFLDENGEVYKISETMSLIKDLELKCTKSHQVSDLLRDRLQNVGAELIDARGRVSELEVADAANRDVLRASTSSVSATTQQVSELAECLKKQQGEIYEVLSTAADAEAKLSASTARVTQLENIVAEKNLELQYLHEIQQENTRLLDVLQDRDARISSLESTEQKVSTLQLMLKERDMKIGALEANITVHEENLSEVKAGIVHLQTQLEDANAVGQTLRENLRACEAREQAAVAEKEWCISDGRTLHSRLGALETQLEQSRKELDARSEKLHQANTRCQVLEERFEDQSVTMKLTREANGDLQERLVAAEAKFARDMENATGKLTCDIASLSEKKLHLQAKIDDLNAQVKRQDNGYSALKLEHSDQLKHQDELYRTRLEAEEKRASRAERDLDASRALSESLREKLSGHVDEIQHLREELKEAKKPSPAHEAELRALMSQIDTLQATNDKLLVRARTIEFRYNQGDLTDEEKVFLTGLMQTWKDIHEKAIIAKSNELRRRDNVIKELRSKIHMLESSLAKYLQSQDKVKAIENRSMIDPTAWMSSSGRSSSPAATGPQAPDRDAPSTNVDSTTTARPTPAPLRPQPIRTHAVDPVGPIRVTPARAQVVQSRAADNAFKTPAAARPSPGPAPLLETANPRPNFSRIATDASDEILDFEDGANHRMSPPVTLGKRDKTSSSPRDADIQSIPRPSKRLRATTRKPEERANEEQANPPSKLKKPTEQPSMKTRSRKRR